MANGDNNLPPDPSNYDPNSPLNQFSKEEAKNANDLAQAARSLTEELKDQLGIRSRLNETEKETLNLARQLQRSAQENTVEIGNQGNIERQLVKDRKLALNIERELADLKSTASEAEIKFAEKIANTNDRINEIQKELAEASGKRATELKDQLAVQEDILRFSLEDAKASVQRMALAMSMSDTAKELIAQRQVEAEVQKDINDKMGVTGALVKGTGALMERLGMRSGIFQDAMKESAAEMQKMSEETVRGTANFSKLEIMMKGFSTLSAGFGKALFDPFTVITAIVDQFLKLNKAQTEFIQLTGQSYDSLAGLNTEVATLGDMMEIAAGYTKETGLNAAGIFTPQQLGGISDAHQLLGLTAAEAGNLGSLMKMSNQSAEGFTDTVLNGVTAMNAQTGAAVANKVVLQDVLGASDDIKASLGGSPENLMKAAHAARKLGLDLTKVNQIADGLLDFEDSIQNELEAQLLTGKQINLSKARELALNNDLEGVANELAKNGASAAEFANMNRVQQESMAKALGMSREEMGKMLIAQTAQGDLTDEQRQKILGVNAEQLKQMDIQSRISKSVEKLAQAFAPVLEAVVPIAESILQMIQPLLAVAGSVGKVLAGFLKLEPVVAGIKIALAGFAAFKFTGALASITGLTAKQNIFNAALAKGFSEKQILAGFAGKAAKDATQMTIMQTAALKLQTAATKVAAGVQKAFNFVVGLGQKIMSGFGTAASAVGSRIGQLTRFLGLNTLAQKASNVATQFGNFLANSWLGRQAARIGAWIAETAGIGANTIAKFSNTAATAGQAAANATLATSQSAVATTGAAAGGGLAAAGAGLGAFGAAAAPAIPILLAIGAALLMASPAIYAIGQMIVGLATVIGNVLIKALEMIPVVIDSMVNGFTTVFTLLTENIGTLFLMGPALFNVAAGLIGIAGGLSLLAIAGIAAIPALAALSTFAVMVTPLAMIGGLFGEGETEEDGSMAEISAKLDTLIAVVQEGGNVYLDGNRVGETQVIGSYKLS